MKQILNEGQNSSSLLTNIQNHNVLTQSRQIADQSPFSRQKFLNEQKKSSDKQRFKKNREGGTNQDDECSSQSLSNSSNNSKSMGPTRINNKEDENQEKDGGHGADAGGNGTQAPKPPQVCSSSINE